MCAWWLLQAAHLVGVGGGGLGLGVAGWGWGWRAGVGAGAGGWGWGWGRGRGRGEVVVLLQASLTERKPADPRPCPQSSRPTSACTRAPRRGARASPAALSGPRRVPGTGPSA